MSIVNEDGTLKLKEAAVFQVSHGFGLGAIGAILPTFSYLYSEVFGVDAAILSATQLVAGMVAVFSIVVMGRWSDCLDTPMGRRRPFVLVLPPLICVCWAFLLQPALFGGGNEGAVYAIFYVGFVVVYFSYIVVTGAWGVELTRAGPARVRFFVLGSVLGLVGAMVGLGLYVATGPDTGSGDSSDDDNNDDDEAEDNPDGRIALSIIIVTLVLGSNGALFTMLGERADVDGADVTRQPPFVPSIHAALNNSQFMMSLTLTVCNGLSNSVLLLLPFLLHYAVGAEHTQRLYSVFGGVVVTCSVISVMNVPWLVARHGKIKVVRTGLLGAGIAAALLLPLTYTESGAVVILLGIPIGAFGGLIAANYSAVQADAIDYDELRSGRRREGMFVAVASLPDKFIAIAGASIPLAIMAALGFDTSAASDDDDGDDDDDDQPEAAVFALRVWCSWVVAASLFIAFVAFGHYKLDEETMQEIKDEVDKHKRGEAARDPITGVVLPPRGGVVSEETYSILAQPGTTLSENLHLEAGDASLGAGRNPLHSEGKEGASSRGSTPPLRDDDLDDGFGPNTTSMERFRITSTSIDHSVATSSDVGGVQLISDREILETLTLRERHTLAVTVRPAADAAPNPSGPVPAVSPMGEGNANPKRAPLIDQDELGLGLEANPSDRSAAEDAELARRTLIICFHVEAIFFQPIWMILSILLAVRSLTREHPLAFLASTMVVAFAFLTFYEAFRWHVFGRLRDMQPAQSLGLALACAELEEELEAQALGINFSNVPPNLVPQVVRRQLFFALFTFGVGCLIYFTGA
eukprot:CAMPEP_0118855370 /NCGR_PEP_ID=MMETSP1163-20130328/3216_1 /TAXON_ID=124430 /ORGANISM="Phaeomonas parva, Strain CCMP2877" /LENGTH=805 /DNA_ID=CAMNT_0006788251 /DNA_START=210 /DNA_END=2627 /DNA_ORIENTATION=-